MAKRKLWWRMQTDDQGAFDELVIGDQRRMHPRSVGPSDGCAVHVEMTDERSGYVSVCDRMLWFTVDQNGKARITNEEKARR